jgi:hypothetical protein
MSDEWMAGLEKKADRRAASLEAAKIKATPYTLGKIIFYRIKAGDAALRDQMLALAGSVDPCNEFGASSIEDLVKVLGHDVKEYG